MNLKIAMQSSSVLHFTHEIGVQKSLAFLDVCVSRTRDGTLTTSVHIKSTYNGECMNYLSLAPEQYKSGVIKTFLHRAYKISHDWIAFNAEINRIKQVLVNNNYPQNLVENQVNKFLSYKLSHHKPPEKLNNIQLFYRNQMTSKYKQDEAQLKKIIYDNVKPVQPNSRLQLNIYYTSRKLANLFIKNNSNKTQSPSNCVYCYTCNEDGCKPSLSYIGYTTCTLVERMRNHAQTGSIQKHANEVHNRKLTTNNIIDCTSVIEAHNNKQDLILAEALLIKDENPLLNSQKEGQTRILHIF